MPDNLSLYCALDFHADHAGPGRITGTLITYGETSADSRRHVFTPGSLHWDPAGVVLNRQHSDSSPIARILPQTDGDRLMVDHSLPDTAAGRDAATEVRNGLLIGLSAEVRVEKDRHEAGRRLIERAELAGAAIVTRPAFRSTAVTVHERQRARRRVWL